MPEWWEQDEAATDPNQFWQDDSPTIAIAEPIDPNDEIVRSKESLEIAREIEIPIIHAEEIAEARDGQKLERPGFLKRAFFGFVNKAFVQPFKNIQKFSTFGELDTQMEALSEMRRIKEETGREVDSSEIPKIFEKAKATVGKRIQEQVPSLQLPPAKGVAEKGIEVVTGVGAFVTKLAIARRFVGGSGAVAEIAAFEAVNQVDGGPTGMGVLLASSLGLVGKIPAATTIGKVGKSVAQGGVLASVTAAQGGDPEDIAVAFLLPGTLRALSQFPHLVRGKAFEAKIAKDLHENKGFTIKDSKSLASSYRDAAEVSGGNMSPRAWGAKHGNILNNIRTKYNKALDTVVKRTTPETAIQKAQAKVPTKIPKVAPQVPAKIAEKPPTEPVTVPQPPSEAITTPEGEIVAPEAVGEGEVDFTKDSITEPTQATPSEEGYVYHATNIENAQDIADSGEISIHEPDFGTDQTAWPDGAIEGRAYFSGKAGVVWSFAPEDGKPAILRVKKDAANFKKESTGDIYSTKAIPASAVEILTEDGWKPLVTPTPEAKPTEKVEGELPKAGDIQVAHFDTETGQIFTYKGAHADVPKLEKLGISEQEFLSKSGKGIIQGGWVDSKGEFFTDANKALEKTREGLPVPITGKEATDIVDPRKIPRLDKEDGRRILFKYKGKNYIIEQRYGVGRKRGDDFSLHNEDFTVVGSGNFRVEGKTNRALMDAAARQIDSISVEPTPKAQKVEAPEIKTVEEKKAEERDILGGVDPITQIQIGLKAAKAMQPKTEAEKKAELKRRAGKARGIAKSLIAKGVPVEEALRRSTSALQGPLTEYDQVYESIADKLEPGAKNEAELMIWRHPELKYFEKLNTDASFNKLINGSALTPGDVQNIERVFGKQFEEFTKPREVVSDLYEKAISLWKAGLLTGLKTQGLNALANVSHAMTETAKDIPAAGVDKIASLFTKERTLAFTTQGVPGGVKEGIERGWRYLRTGIDIRNVGAKLDYNRVNFGTSKIARGLQTYEETIFHMLGAADQPFYYGAKARSLYSQAIAQAKNKGLKGKEAGAFIDNLVQNPTDDMLEWATHDAEVAVFQNRTKAGDIAKSIQKVKGGEIVVPFGRTPAAVATQIINYSPIGVVKEVADQVHKGKFNQRKFSQAAGRTILGTGALYIGTQLFKAGLLALDFPDNEKERELWKAEGRKANSIKVGDKWRDVQVLGPAGNLLVIGGHFQQALEKTGSPTEAMVESLAGGAKSFSEQTFVRGVNLAVDAITDPERSFDRWFTSMAGSVVPTIVADIARAQDEIGRRTVGPFQRVQSRIPFYRRGLEPAIDVFGQDVPRYGGNVLETMIDPTRPSKIRQDVVVDELRRLWDKNIKVSPTQLGDKKGYDILTAEENTQLWRRSGELTYKALFNMMQTKGYKEAGKDTKVSPDFAKGVLINGIINDAKTAAKLEMVTIKVAEGKTILEMTEAGLFSIEGFEMLKYFNENPQ